MKKTKTIVYSTSWCSFCHSLMHWLDQLGIDYEDIDVEADADAREDMLRRTEGRFVVPVTIIGDETIIGFDRPAIKATLRKQTPSNG